MIEQIAATFGVNPDDVVKGLIGAGSTAVVGLIIALLKTPEKVKSLEKRIATLEGGRRRAFRKIRRLEQYVIEKELRAGAELTDLLKEMRDDQRSSSDDRDASEDRSET
ncbi:MAG: hypothetical protein RBT63_00450 [Bdellovibrionales bacterium]|jgi:hypothetical protein|nr:hypothetical protein [Bdellovibrionales bacterium]